MNLPVNKLQPVFAFAVMVGELKCLALIPAPRAAAAAPAAARTDPGIPPCPWAVLLHSSTCQTRSSEMQWSEPSAAPAEPLVLAGPSARTVLMGR